MASGGRPGSGNGGAHCSATRAAIERVAVALELIEDKCRLRGFRNRVLWRSRLLKIGRGWSGASYRLSYAGLKPSFVLTPA
jgi:hypothetical protein